MNMVLATKHSPLSYVVSDPEVSCRVSTDTCRSLLDVSLSYLAIFVTGGNT